MKDFALPTYALFKTRSFMIGNRHARQIAYLSSALMCISYSKLATVIGADLGAALVTKKSYTIGLPLQVLKREEEVY